ncbi:UNVERIFIED_CONTAM: Deleted in lung and esophageal cancer protein 1 [Siphonaria sp. JEL0065]|nr:Deleted in lung and esophageal cancer protein 1 [Siphonaria sp. JEL0065]
MASRSLPPLPTLVPQINEPDHDRDRQLRDQHQQQVLKHAGSVPVLSIHRRSSKKKQDVISSQLSKIHNSNIDLAEIKKRDLAILNLIDDSHVKKPDWLKTIPEIQPKGKLPRGASTIFRSELEDLDRELQDAKAYLKTWSEVQAKALESLVYANKDLKSYKPPKPPAPVQEPVVLPGKNERLTSGSASGPGSASSKRAPPPKSASKAGSSLKASPTKTGKSSSNLMMKKGSMILPVGKDPRTGITVGEENAALLVASTLETSTPAGTLVSKEKPPPENWPSALWDTCFKLTPMYISETLYRLAPDDDTLVQLRDGPLNKSDWITKIIKERNEIIDRISQLESRVLIAERDMKWVSGHRDYGLSKSMMVSTVFSDYAQDNALRVPGLGSPEAEAPISDLELLKLGAPTSGIFNQVRNVMISRTDSGLQQIWLMKKNISDNFEVPGLLEVDAMDHFTDLNTTPTKGAALEPKKVIVHKPKNSMKPFQEEDVELLKRMRSRVNFLRNPRFPPNVLHDCIGILRDDVMPIVAADCQSTSEEVAAKALRSVGGGIVAIPSCITFTDYQPHHTYSKILTIKNRSTFSARFRLCIPPPFEYSPFFNVTMISTPSNGDGLVAPGMGCQYRVDFTPNTLSNFQQILVVYTELGGNNLTGASFEPYQVVLSGVRAAPELTMPDVLHCGPCRDGFVAIRKWTFKNIGGAGRFMILGGEDDRDVAQLFEEIGTYATEQEYRNAIMDKSNEIPYTSSLTQDAFEISPSYFTLSSGETQEITVKFRADPITDPLETTTTKVETILQIACDNCQVLELPLRANIQKASVAITSCDPASMRALEEEAWDIEGVKFLFGNQNLQATTSMTLTIRNQGRLKLPFVWVPVENPGFDPKAIRNYSVSALYTESTVTVSDSLAFSPARGVFAPNGDVTFQVSFTPTRAKKYDVIGRLLLVEEGDRVFINQETGLPVVNTNPNAVFEQECVLEVFCTGVGLEYSVQVKPEMILVPSTIYTGYSKETQVRIVNSSISAVTYEWSVENIDIDVMKLAISVPDVLVVEPGHDLNFLVSMAGVFPGNVNGSLVCKTANGIGPLIRVPIHATIELKPGDLEFGATIIDFGLMALGTSAASVVPLINNSVLPLHYRLVAHSSTQTNTDTTKQNGIIPDDWCLNISEPEGTLNPNEQIFVTLTFIPIWYQTFRGILTCEIIPLTESPLKHSVSSLVTAIDMCAQVQTPSAMIDYPENNVISYLNEPFDWNFVITNKTLLKTKCQWKPVKRDDISVLFKPERADLGPGESINVCISLTFKEIGVSQSAEFECNVDGMVENGGVLKAKIQADVLGLSVDLKFSDRFSASCSRVGSASVEASIDNEVVSGNVNGLDFGNDCPIFESRTLAFTIQNKSAIASPYRLWVETFTALGVDKPGFDEQESPTTNLGQYNDRLVCEIGSWLREVIPITLGVDGVPVKFSGAQLVASKGPSKIDRVNFGTQIAQYGRRVPLPKFGADYSHARKSVFARFGASSIYGKNPRETAEEDENTPTATITKKEIQVENQSPRTICLRWNVFVKRQPLNSIVAQQNAGTTPSTAEIDALLLDELIDNNPITSPVVVQPGPMFIPAFKTVSARISFCAKETGYYKALLVADVGYVQPDGSISFSPNGDVEDDYFFDSVSFENSLLAPLKKLREKKVPFPEGLSLPRIRKVRLLVQGKAIEPSLVMDDVNSNKKEEEEGKQKCNSVIWFKKVRDDEITEMELQHKKRQQAIKEAKLKEEREETDRTRHLLLAQHKNTQSVFIYSDGLKSSLNSKYFTSEYPEHELSDTTSSISKLAYLEDDENPTSLITLRNNTDTVTSFSLKISSKDIFKVTKVEKPQTPSAAPPKSSAIINLSQMRGSTSIIGTPKSKPSTEPQPYRSSQASRGKIPFTAPTAAQKSPASAAPSLSKVSVETSKPPSSNSKKSKTPTLGEEEDEITDDIVYELHPMETIRIAVECLNTDILKTTTVEDNTSTNPSYIQSRATTANGSRDKLLSVSRPETANKKSMVFMTNDPEPEDHSQDYVKGHLKVVFTNGTVQTIPILCED